MKKIKSLTKQGGYTATAMIAMLAVGGIVTAGTARHTLTVASESQGQTYGTALASVNKAVGTYTILNYKALVDGTAIPGVANALQPTVQELNALGLPNAQINATPPMGGAYAILISREPVGCVAPNCNLTSRAWFTRPITNPDTGNVDIERLGAAAQVIGGDGGWSAPDAPGTVRGTAGWSRANPAGNTAGILLAINGYGSSVFANYIDRQGVQGMLADLKLGNNNINGVKTVNARDLTLAAGRNLNIGGSQIYGDGNNTGIYQSGSLFIEHHDYSAADIGKVRNVTSEGTLTSRRMVANGTGTLGAADNWAYDVSAGTIGAGKSVYSYNAICAGNTSADCTGSGGVVMTSAGHIVSAGTNYSQEAVLSGWLRSTGDAGWYSQKWGGGLYMSDPNWIRSYADRGIYTGAQVQAGSLQSNSSLYVAGNATVVGSQTVYGSVAAASAITPGVIAWEGGYCGGNGGAIGRDGNNNLYICN